MKQIGNICWAGLFWFLKTCSSSLNAGVKVGYKKSTGVGLVRKISFVGAAVFYLTSLAVSTDGDWGLYYFISSAAWRIWLSGEGAWEIEGNGSRINCCFLFLFYYLINMETRKLQISLFSLMQQFIIIFIFVSTEQFGVNREQAFRCQWSDIRTEAVSGANNDNW